MILHGVYTPRFATVQASVDGHLGCFYFLPIVTNDVLNMGAQISLQDPAFNCLSVFINILEMRIQEFGANFQDRKSLWLG